MQLLQRLTLKPHRVFAPETLTPDTPFWAIGDVHGRYDLLAPLLDDLLATGDQIVLLGDMINKGPQSAQVLNLVKQAAETGEVIALRGNHEELLIRFLERPRVETPHLLAYGGSTTLESFGITGLAGNLALWEMSKTRDALKEAMGDLVGWLNGLPYSWKNGNIVALHAGADPEHPLTDQPAQTFAWGHPQFASQARHDGVWVVHGHRPVPSIEVKAGRISINTLPSNLDKLGVVRVANGQIMTR